MNLVLISEIILNNFSAKIYKQENYDGAVVDESHISNQFNMLDSQETAVELAQTLTNFDGVVQVDIFNKSDSLIFTISSII